MQVKRCGQHRRKREERRAAVTADTLTSATKRVIIELTELQPTSEVDEAKTSSIIYISCQLERLAKYDGAVLCMHRWLSA